MTMDVLTTVYVGNAIGIALLLTLFFSNVGRFTEDRDLKNVIKLIVIAGLSCVADPLVYTVDGHPGMLNTIIIYAGNSWLYLANMLVGRMWVNFLANHINMRLPAYKKRIYNILFAFGLACLIINIFKPIVFSVEHNVYQRTTLYAVFVLIAAYYMLESIGLYLKARKLGGIFTFFPIQVFLIPVIAGIVIQSMFYGISVIWTSVAIAIAGIMTALKNEIIFTDSLTGIYNRIYLDCLQREIYRKKNMYVTGMMIDINGFKTINDQYGHSTGDEALVIVAHLLRDVIGERGRVMRYAGDEFVILLNVVDDVEIKNIERELHEAMSRFNETGKKPYKISMAIGYASLDLKTQTINDFMNEIDKKMYEQKNAYYMKSHNDRRR